MVLKEITEIYIIAVHCKQYGPGKPMKNDYLFSIIDFSFHCLKNYLFYISIFFKNEYSVMFMHCTVHLVM